MHYIAPNKQIHYLSEEDIARGGESLLPAGCVPITDAEAKAIRAEQNAQQTQDPQPMA